MPLRLRLGDKEPACRVGWEVGFSGRRGAHNTGPDGARGWEVSGPVAVKEDTWGPTTEGSRARVKGTDFISRALKSHERGSSKKVM